ncbi:hypothetical protein ColTof4_02612 [Colletotrichum tofieldiae]|nr:hypothetical protein ColTof4_02612 [Colletotrichum tofieldiae]GKT93237.1 hypothetical protein Ct61P_11087 [Colletotrichum tofieldiae]
MTIPILGLTQPEVSLPDFHLSLSLGLGQTLVGAQDHCRLVQKKASKNHRVHKARLAHRLSQKASSTQQHPSSRL